MVFLFDNCPGTGWCRSIPASQPDVSQIGGPFQQGYSPVPGGMPGAGEDEGIVFPRLVDEQSSAFQQANDLPDSPPLFRVEGADQFIARLAGYGLRKDQDCGLRARQ